MNKSDIVFKLYNHLCLCSVVIVYALYGILPLTFLGEVKEAEGKRQAAGGIKEGCNFYNIFLYKKYNFFVFFFLFCLVVVYCMVSVQEMENSIHILTENAIIFSDVFFFVRFLSILFAFCFCFFSIPLEIIFSSFGIANMPNKFCK